MNIQAQTQPVENPFESAREKCEELVSELSTPRAASLTHSEVESLISTEGMEFMRRLFQGHLDSRGPGEVEETVSGSDGLPRPHARMRGKQLMSVFGPVRLTRMGYRGRELESLYPLDGELNLPRDTYTFGARRRIVEEAVKDSFDQSVESVRKTTGANIPKRQAEQLVERAGADFEAFYRQREFGTPGSESAGSLMVLTVDGKGVVMRKKDLRPETRKAASKQADVLDPSTTEGLRRHRKRMATVAAVYTIEPYQRSPEELVAKLRRQPRDVKRRRPRPEDKRVWASLEKEPYEVIKAAFEEAHRRDPNHKKQWVVLVDGDENQLGLLEYYAQNNDIELTIVLDLMHVLGYMWKAAHAFHPRHSQEAEEWVFERLLAVLNGRAGYVAGGMRRSATRRDLSASKRKPVDKCANYLLKYSNYLRYDDYLSRGLPIATGVIEGACRHLVKDRLEITGARWSLHGAEAVLKLRAIHCSRDFDEYWKFHECQEKRRNHVNRYERGIPRTRRPNLCASAKDQQSPGGEVSGSHSPGASLRLVK